jgi:hypothetical protein
MKRMAESVGASELMRHRRLVGRMEKEKALRRDAAAAHHGFLRGSRR